MRTKLTKLKQLAALWSAILFILVASCAVEDTRSLDTVMADDIVAIWEHPSYTQLYQYTRGSCNGVPVEGNTVLRGNGEFLSLRFDGAPDGEPGSAAENRDHWAGVVNFPYVAVIDENKMCGKRFQIVHMSNVEGDTDTDSDSDTDTDTDADADTDTDTDPGPGPGLGCSVNIMEIFSAGHIDSNTAVNNFVLANGVTLSTVYGFYASSDCLNIRGNQLPGTTMLCVMGRDPFFNPAPGILFVGTPSDFTDLTVKTCDHDQALLVAVNGSGSVKEVPGAGEDNCSNSSTNLSWMGPSSAATLLAQQTDDNPNPEAFSVVSISLTGGTCQ